MEIMYIQDESLVITLATTPRRHNLPIGDSFDDGFHRHVQVDDSIDMRNIFQGHGLLTSSGETIQQERLAFFEVGCRILHDELNHEFIGHESPRVHVLLSFLSEFGLLSDVFTENVTGGNVMELGKVLKYKRG